MKVFLSLLILFCFTAPLYSVAAEYGVAITATPVLNRPDFKTVFGGSDGRTLKTDSCGQVRELEYIALPGTMFSILDKKQYGEDTVYEVSTDEYVATSNIRLYVDSRFLNIMSGLPEARRALLPKRAEILAALRASVGAHYVWGGNISSGVPELAKWYFTRIEDNDKERHLLAGLDCSGLLYSATNGITPRNTSQLISFGQGIEIKGKKNTEIIKMLQPLDLIVWDGHVIIVLDQQSAIESRLDCSKYGNGGVIISKLSDRVTEIMHKRQPENSWPPVRKKLNIFVVRRWLDPSQ